MKRLGLTLVAACSLSLCSCDKLLGGDDGPGSDPANGPESGPEAAARAKAGELREVKPRGVLPKPGAPVVPAAETPGPAYFAVEGGGLVKLDAGTFSPVAGAPDKIRDLAPAADGSLWMLTAYKIHNLKDGEVKTIDGKGGGTLFDKIAVGPKGEVWVTGLYGLGLFQDGMWQEFKKEQVDPLVKGSFSDLLVDADGRVWLISHEGIHVYEQGKWSTVNTGGDDPMYLGEAWLADDGLYIIATGGTLKMTGEKWLTVSTGSSFISANHLGIGPKGRLQLLNYRSVTWLTLGGGGTRSFSTESGDIPKTGQFNDFFVDSQGRSWVATEGGPMVINKDGEIKYWAQGTVPQLPGSIEAIYVQGQGPALPETVGKIQTASIRGKLVGGKGALANVPIEVCQSPRMMHQQGETPCSTNPFKKSAVTGADGSFSFKEVPLGRYEFTFKNGEKWTITLGGNKCCADMKAGQDYDVGVLRVK